MRENLKTTKFNDGSTIPHITDAVAWSVLITPSYSWYYNDESSYRNAYGAMYNWYAVNTGKLCPIGWHVPSDEEWKTLEKYLGMSQIEADATGWRGTNQGDQIKNTTGWYMGNGTNVSGFTGLPGGAHSFDGTFVSVGVTSLWWSSSESGLNNAWNRVLFDNYTSIDRYAAHKRNGYSVRCLKD